MDIFIIGIASFSQVFLLGLNSQFVRDQKMVRVFIVSWFISLAQFAFIRAISLTDDTTLAFLASAIGGSVGITGSVAFYKWLGKR